MNLIFDLETDGLLDDLTKIHCLCIHDLDTGQTQTFNDEGTQEPIVRGIQQLELADHIIGHNIIGFDNRVIHRLYPWWTPTGNVLDTLVLSRIYHPNLVDIDTKRRWPMMELKMYGRHSLEAWGYRLGAHKGCFAKDTDWKEWCPEMEQYMEQDVVVTIKLWEHFLKYLRG